jgi:hypothetical protein
MLVVHPMFQLHHHCLTNERSIFVFDYNIADVLFELMKVLNHLDVLKLWYKQVTMMMMMMMKPYLINKIDLELKIEIYILRKMIIY